MNIFPQKRQVTNIETLERYATRHKGVRGILYSHNFARRDQVLPADGPGAPVRGVFAQLAEDDERHGIEAGAIAFTPRIGETLGPIAPVHVTEQLIADGLAFVISRHDLYAQAAI